MSDQDPNHPRRPRFSFPPQPHQLVGPNHEFTPYYVPNAEAHRFSGRATPHLSNGLHHPPQNFPTPRNPFPGTDPIMDARREDGEKSGVLSYEQVVALKKVEDMTVDERHARDAKEFSASPPDALSQAQKQRWADLVTELLETKKKPEDEAKDPYKIRPRGELRKLKQLADLAGGQ
ncbi:MAG: hypothetical protein ALECFALPRED_005285 [Alectoria fallacina]|uniref:Uncharacterized protein n=1 Tax=Alectoria fallacina TaxID=1903189 RepID=A0A8H3G0M3_9LECA|nr:MAG: hypothetical protein ALECFALPRED_005285 [Alectoria fallacina]